MKFYAKAVHFTFVRTKTDGEVHKYQHINPYYYY